MKSKIVSKNKNVINIRINTGKKEKRVKKVKRSATGGGRSSYNSAYTSVPPIIIQPHQPAVFPQYNPPNGVINQVRESNHIISHTQQEQPIQIPIAHAVPVSNSPQGGFINPVNVTSVPIAESVGKKWRQSVVERNNDFINNTSIHPVTIAKAIEEEIDNFHTPMKPSHSSPYLDTIQHSYENNDDDDAQFTNPMVSVKEMKKHEPEPEIIDFPEKKRKEKNTLALATYHSKVDDFSNEKYYKLLEKWNSLHPDQKPDGDFAGKKPSKNQYIILLGKVNKLEKQNRKAPTAEPLELVPLEEKKKGGKKQSKRAKKDASHSGLSTI